MPKRVVRRRVRRRRPAPLTGLLALGTAGAVVAAVLVVGGGTPTVQASQRTATVTKGVIQTVVSGSGNLEPIAQQDVDFATSGRVTDIYVHTGERIGKGDLIARIDSSTQQVAVDKAQADLTNAQDAVVKAEATPTPTPTPSGRTRAVATPAPTVDAASVASAQANVESAQLALKQAQDDLAATELRAPISGTVAAINGAVGDTVGSSSPAASSTATASGSSGFVVLADLHRLKMQVALTESDIGKVHKGQSATVTINAASGEKVAAHVTSVGVLASSSSSGSGAVSYPVDVTLDQSAHGVKAGMSATADIVVAQASGLMVPTQALRGSTVTVLRNGRRSTQAVETGVVGDSDTQIVSGLKAGDQVVVTSTAATLGRATSGSGQTGGLRGGFGGPGAGFRGFAGGGRVVQIGPGG